MITVTDAAGECLARMLDEAAVQGGVVLRLVLDDDGVLEPTLDGVRQGDVSYEHEGRPVLALDCAAAQHLAGRTLDAVQTSDGLQLQPT